MGDWIIMLDVWPGLLLATTAPPAPGNPMGMFVFLMASLFLLYYFIILRPQKKEESSRKSVLEAVAKGDHVVTIGGIHGTVESIDVTKGIVAILIAPKTSVRVNKSALQAVTPKAEKKKKKGAKDDHQLGGGSS